MKYIKITIVLSAAALFALACAENKPLNNNSATETEITKTAATANTDAAPPTAAPDELATQKIYFETCVGCHRENGSGGPAEYEGKKIKVPSFQSKSALNSSDDKLYDYIAEGEEDEMPAFKNKLTEPQMRDLVRFIRTEFQKR